MQAFFPLRALAGARYHGGNPVSPVGPLVLVHKGSEAGKAGLSFAVISNA